MAHVFISYAHEDGTDYADIVQARLKKRGIDIWVDDNLKVGDIWSPMIDAAIRSAYAFILIVTPKATISQYVTYEVGFAMGCGVPVFPLNFTNTDMTTLIQPLSKLNILPFFDSKSRPWDDLITRLKELNTTPVQLEAKPDNPPFIQEALLKLESMDANVREQTLETLASSTHPAALETLAVKGIQHHFPDVKRRAGFLLAEKTKCQDTRALDGLIAAFDPKAFGSAERAAQIIKQYGQAGISTFVALLDHPYSHARVIAVRSLGEMNATEVLPRLAEMLLKDVNHSVFQTILQALHNLGDTSIVPSLKQRLAQVGNNNTVLFQIAGLLVQFNDLATAIPMLIDLLRDSNYNDESSNLLLRIGSVAAPQIATAIESPDPSVRERSIVLLMHLGYEDAIPGIIARLDDKDVLVRRAAIRALGYFKVTTEEDRLISLLSDEDVQIAAKSALRMLGTERANAALAALDSAPPSN